MSCHHCPCIYTDQIWSKKKKKKKIINLSAHFFGHSFRFQPGQGIFRGCFVNSRNILVTKICTKTYIVLFVPLLPPSPHLYQDLLCNICTQTYFVVAMEQLKKEKSVYLKFFVLKNNSKVNQIVQSFCKRILISINKTSLYQVPFQFSFSTPPPPPPPPHQKHLHVCLHLHHRLVSLYFPFSIYTNFGAVYVHRCVQIDQIWSHLCTQKD